MSRRRQGLISVRVPPEPPSERHEHGADEVVSLPPRNVLDAGVDKFFDLTHIGVAKKGTEAFLPFDFTDRRLLRVVLGLTFIHMQEYAEKELKP